MDKDVIVLFITILTGIYCVDQIIRYFKGSV